LKNKKNIFKLILSSLLFFITSVSAYQSNGYDMWPNVIYSDEIPTHQEILGYKVGEKITSHSDMLDFFYALEKSAPKRIKLFEYGRTWEGRKLIYLAIGSEENLNNLGNFSSDMRALADPRFTNKSQVNNLISKLPGSVWLGYGVHGNEISSTDAAMMTAYHLLAAPDETVNRNILANTIVFIDPLQNPDGRSRFTNRYYETVGLEGSADRLSAEHNEPWPQGRSNHYLFDMNRDWLALTQPESQGRVKAISHYLPLVVIDLHEMGGDSSYYFAPPAQPLNPHMTQTQIENTTLIGQNNGKHFDQFGFDFFTREIFDAFYPGYGDSWPVFYGAAASTYEVSSSRGERFQKATGELLTYKDSVQRHFVASISTAEGMADNREKFLKDFYQYQVSAIAEGKANKNERVYIFPNKRDKAGNHRLATLMAAHGVEVNQADKNFKVCGKHYPAGSYYIDTAQPKGRFAKTALTKQVNMPEAFIKEQERRRARKLDDEIYDVTGWSLPLMFNIDTNTCGSAIKVVHHRINADDKLKGEVKNTDASVAYIVPWGDMSAGRFLTAALRKGLTIKSADKAFTLNNETKYPAGSLIIEKRTNSAELFNDITTLAKQTGAVVTGVDTSWVTQGPSFGSSNTVTMPVPKIAMAWDEPTNSLSAGNTRFVIERQFNYPVTAIRTSTLISANLSQYHVLILPSGNYQKVFNKNAIANIKSWVNNGGVLITLGNATRFAADINTGLLDVKLEQAYKKAGKAKKITKEDKKKSTIAGRLLNSKAELISAIENTEDKPNYVAGVLTNVEVDQEHWLTAGVHHSVAAMVVGNDIYTPIKLGSGKNVAWFKGKDKVLASGYLWEEVKQQLAYKPFLIHQPMGKGMVIAFTQEPASRAYLDGLNVMLLNTIFRGAAHASPLK
jgi:hypothetical protein